MKRDLFKDGFTAEDFKAMVIPAFCTDINTLLAKHATKLLREALAEAPTVECDDGHGMSWFQWETNHRVGPVQKAKLVAIKAIDNTSEG